jgi:hypothetical protein
MNGRKQVNFAGLPPAKFVQPRTIIFFHHPLLNPLPQAGEEAIVPSPILGEGYNQRLGWRHLPA